MNFLNDSLKQLKTVLAEGLESQVNFDSSASEGGLTAQAESSQEHENLRKLCQHQSDEVISQCFHYCAVFTAHDFRVAIKTKEIFRWKICVGNFFAPLEKCFDESFKTTTVHDAAENDNP